MNRILIFLAMVVVALVAGLHGDPLPGGSVRPASAHHTNVSGETTCLDEHGRSVITWYVVNPDEDWQPEGPVELKANVTLSPNPLSRGATATGTQLVQWDQSFVTFTVSATWTNGNVASNKATVWKPQTCPPPTTSTVAPPTVPDTTSTTVTSTTSTVPETTSTAATTSTTEAPTTSTQPEPTTTEPPTTTETTVPPTALPEPTTTVTTPVTAPPTVTIPVTSAPETTAPVTTVPVTTSIIEPPTTVRPPSRPTAPVAAPAPAPSVTNLPDTGGNSQSLRYAGLLLIGAGILASFIGRRTRNV